MLGMHAHVGGIVDSEYKGLSNKAEEYPEGNIA